jgi:hypothetical protein
MSNINERLGCLIVYSLFLLAIISGNLVEPEYNWDMMGYIGSVKAISTNDTTNIHNKTYGIAKQVLSQEDYRNITNKTEYRENIASNPKSFVETLNFYHSRVFYVYLLYLVTSLGINIVHATYLIPMLFVCLSLGIIYFISKTHLGYTLGAVSPLLVALSGGARLAGHSSPDGIAFFSVVLISFLFLREKYTYVLILSPLLVLARPNLLILSLLFNLSIIIYRNVNIYYTLFSILVSVTLFTAIRAIWPHPGWSSLFHNTFTDSGALYPISSSYQVSYYMYLKTLFSRIGRNFLSPDSLMNIYLFSFLIFTYTLLRNKMGNVLSYLYMLSNKEVLVTILSVFTLSHFILFPKFSYRFFSPVVLLTIILTISIVASDK